MSGAGEASGEEAGRVATIGAVTSAGGAGLFLLLRILAVSDWNWHTAFAVAHTVNFDDVIGIVLGTLMANETLVGVLLVWLLPLSVIHAAWPLDGGDRSAGAFLLAVTMMAASFTLVISAPAWWLLVGAAVVAASIVFVRLVRHRGRVHAIVFFLLRRVGVMALLGALVLAAVVQTPWVPLERIETEDGPLTGYVMASDPGFLKVLTEHERELLILVESTVVSREETGAH